MAVERQVPTFCQVRWLWFLQCYLASQLRPSAYICNNDTCGLSGWDIHDTVYSKELLISNKTNGYSDIIAVIDLSSFRRIPWEDHVPFFLVSFLDPNTKLPLSVDPRGVLQLATEKAEAAGYKCFSGIEYEVRLDIHIFQFHL